MDESAGAPPEQILLDETAEAAAHAFYLVRPLSTYACFGSLPDARASPELSSSIIRAACPPLDTTTAPRPLRI